MPSTQTGSLVWNLDIDDGKFKAGLKEDERLADETGRNVDSSLQNMSDGVASSFQRAQGASLAFAGALAGIGIALVGVGNFGIQAAADLETAKQGFITLLGSTEKADAAIEKIKKDAASTPFEMKGLVQANQLLTSVTKDADRSETFLLNIGKALAAMGKGQPELDRVIVNLQQIGAIGHANALDIKQFAFAGIPIYDLLNDALKNTNTLTVDNSKAIGKQTGKLTDLQNSLKVAEQRQKEFNSKTKESTKLANQNSIDKYKAQISSLSGSIGGLTSNNGKLVASQGNLEQAIRDGKITFELLEKVFNDAGTGQGRFARAFIEQAGTFNQLKSNLHDIVSQIAADIVTSTGVFDAVKTNLATVIEKLQEFKPQVIQGIKDAFTFIKDNGPLIAGIIIGGLTPAIVGLATAFLTAAGALAPFILAGAGIALIAERVINSLGGWQNVMVMLQGAFNELVKIYNLFFKPSIDEIVVIIQGQLIPQLKELWTLISPVLGPAITLLAKGLAITLAGALFGVIFILKELIQIFTDTVASINILILKFNDVLPAIKAAFQGVKDAIVKPFQDAFGAVSKIFDDIKSKMDQINPFHRNSPSLIDNIQAGVAIIKSEFGSLKSLSFPQVSGAMTGGLTNPFDVSPASSYKAPAYAGSPKDVSVNVQIGQVNSPMDVDRISREIAFKSSML